MPGFYQETNKKRAGRIGALRLSQALSGSGLLDHKTPTLQEFSSQFLRWVESATLAQKTAKYYRNGWRLLSGTNLVSMRLDHITKDYVDALTSAARRHRASTVLCGRYAGYFTRQKSGTSSSRFHDSSCCLNMAAN